MMDDLDELEVSEFVTDNEDQDSLDEKIDSEQKIRNQQLWTSFQNAASCITKLYKDRSQPWVPFQNAASNLTTLYRDCIESQKRFARIGYQAGRRKRIKEIKKLLKKHNANINVANTTTQQQNSEQCHVDNLKYMGSVDGNATDQVSRRRPKSNVDSILDVKQLNLCGDESTNCMQNNSNLDQLAQGQNLKQNSNSINNHQALGNNEDDLLTFQQALAQPMFKSVKSSPPSSRRHNPYNMYDTRTQLEQAKSEEDRLQELNQFLSDEYHRHVGSKKRSCTSHGGSSIKRMRD